MNLMFSEKIVINFIGKLLKAVFIQINIFVQGKTETSFTKSSFPGFTEISEILQPYTKEGWILTDATCD